MIFKGQDIYLTRGDSDSITIKMMDRDNILIPLKDGDVIYFTVKESTCTSNKVMQKKITVFPDGIAMIELAHEDTCKLEYGRYFYDIQYSNDRTVRTLCGPAGFFITEEVTYE